MRALHISQFDDEYDHNFDGSTIAARRTNINQEYESGWRLYVPQPDSLV